ncbi:MAG: GntR family transcriptional regulator [Clostridia bacterium]
MTIVRSIPLYKKVSSEILKQINKSSFPNNTLPSEEQLSASLGTSKHTVREALAELKSQVYISKRHGIGNTLIRSVLNTQFRIDANMNFIQLLSRAGYAVTLEQSNFRIENLTMLGFQEQNFYAYDEIMYADNKPATTHHMYIPVAIFGQEDVLTECPRCSLFDVFSQHQITAFHSIVEFVPEIADQETSNLFSLHLPSVINTWDEIIYDQNDRPICCTKLRFHPQIFPLRMVRRDFEIVE